MKPFLMITIMLFVLVACGQQDQQSTVELTNGASESSDLEHNEDNVAEKDLDDANSEQTTGEQEESLVSKSEEENNQMDSLYEPIKYIDRSGASESSVELFDIRYNPQEFSIELIHPSGEIETLTKETASIPVKNLEATKALYISPDDFETLGDVYLVDLISGEQKIIAEATENETPKRVIWDFDDQHIYMIKGFAHGTVSVGGNVFKINIETEEVEELTNYDNEIQIIHMELMGDTLYYYGIEYTDDQMMETEPYSNQIQMD
ncbi:DUF4652 domain-containing protein [Alkalihalobacillus trypoxylicola]|uniref:DUF5050 domain-containing protein n=1 Tax=Alkalihalobacillus trypoxylicola TaxID=519424 RepID=A0A162D4I7_9BACI|nr:DUF4652 domain-containing protein [Alkalihalobacillus trypoxylicola]KYG28076.1 hypothetical protein AZF04_09215 [Alkalihalobacillus trypoxylicola]